MNELFGLSTTTIMIWLVGLLVVCLLAIGVIAVTKRSLFTVIEGQPHAFLGTDRRGIESEGPVIDIDDEIDLAVAEAMLANRSSLTKETPQLMPIHCRCASADANWINLACRT